MKYIPSQIRWIALIAVLVFIGRWSSTISIPFKFTWEGIVAGITLTFLGPLVVGVVLWYLGVRESDNKLKRDAIIDLMAYRGDNAAPDFRKALNKAAIIFHDDIQIQTDIQTLYDFINSPIPQPETTERTIVQLIYKLCHRNGFAGLTEFSIAQSFLKESQTPDNAAGSPDAPQIPTPKKPADQKTKTKKPKSKKLKTSL